MTVRISLTCSKCDTSEKFEADHNIHLDANLLPTAALGDLTKGWTWGGLPTEPGERHGGIVVKYTCPKCSEKADDSVYEAKRFIVPKNVVAPKKVAAKAKPPEKKARPKK